MSPCSVYPGKLPASLWLASDSAHEEWPSSFRSWRKSLITPQRAGLVMLPLLPSPGGVENLFQTSICRDISNSLITSQESRGGCLSTRYLSQGLAREASGPSTEVILRPRKAAHRRSCQVTLPTGVCPGCVFVSRAPRNCSGLHFPYLLSRVGLCVADTFQSCPG